MAGVMWVAHFFVVGDVTDHSLTRYQEVHFIAHELARICKYFIIVRVLIHTQICQTSLSQKKAHLVEIQINGGSVADEVDRSAPWGKNSDVRALRLDLLSPECKLKSFFKLALSIPVYNKLVINDGWCHVGCLLFCSGGCD